jgi:hypothetical protein
MTSTEVLSEMERKLDELIANATLLKDCEEEKGEQVDLEHKQEMLLNALLKINNSLDDAEKHLLWQKSPQLYSTLEKKIFRFSRINQTLLKKERFVKKSRVHRRKIRKPPTQLSLDLN